MSAVISPPQAPAAPKIDTVADLLHQLGDIPASRVLWDPIPGTATEADVVRHVDGPERRLVELIDGTLVEKPMGFYEARVGTILAYFIEGYIDEHDVGITLGADAMLRILPRQVRLPDVTFLSWTKMPNRELPAEPVAPLIPDLAVEVLSESNTRREMERKRKDYFAAGVRRVWQIDPDSQTAEVFTAPEQFTPIPADGELDGEDILPGFRLSLKRLFDRAGKPRGT
jgi:Uma2 family endonuclease